MKAAAVPQQWGWEAPISCEHEAEIQGVPLTVLPSRSIRGLNADHVYPDDQVCDINERRNSEDSQTVLWKNGGLLNSLTQLLAPERNQKAPYPSQRPDKVQSSDVGKLQRRLKQFGKTRLCD